jgi:hypothetical protein
MVASNILKFKHTEDTLLLSVCTGLSRCILQARNIRKFNIKETAETMMDDMKYCSTKKTELGQRSQGI